MSLIVSEMNRQRSDNLKENQQLLQFFYQMDIGKEDCSASEEEQEPIAVEEEEEFIPREEEGHIGYITDPHQYLAFCQKDKKIKIMDQINPVFSHVFLKDISLHKKGPLEDKIYSRVDKYYQNIRRGNTLCQIYRPNQEQCKDQLYDSFFCRRGMKKFYDLEPDYLRVGANLTTHHQLMKKRVFQSLEQELQQPGATYHLYCLFKENGEHCQISYVKQLSCWLFASKNVTLLARDLSDLDNYYHKERFYWAKLIGRQFFNILQGMEEGQRQEFKKDIDGFTLLGEHCGNQQHQHITKYHHVQIIFYGLVSNVGFDHCQPVEECQRFLTKYGLKMSRCKAKRGLKDKNSIMATMWEMLKEIAEGTMAEEGEGSVMYIICQREGRERTVGMCKLKTCEYLIYRRLREMLKLNVARKSTANTFQKFKFQIEQLVKHYFKPPKALDFYFELGERAFKECGVNGEINETYLRYKFVEFISMFEEERSLMGTDPSVKEPPKRILIVCLPRLASAVEKYCKSRGYDTETMYRPGKMLSRTVVHILYMIPRLPQQWQDNCHLILPEYTAADIEKCILELEDCKDLSKSQLISFIKSEDKAKTVKMLVDKIQTMRKNCIENKVPFKVAPFTEEGIITALSQLTESKGQVKIEEKNKKPVKTFVFPFLIPGSGKSTLARELLKNQSQCSWKIIDSDALRRQLMEEVKIIDLNEDDSNKIFIQTGKEAFSVFNKTLLEEAQIEPTHLNQCVFIDRIFSPSNIQQAIETLLSTEKDYLRIIVLTQSCQATKIKDKTYPYSLNYLLTCLKRCIERSQHQTMPNNPYLVAKIVLRFYKNMANFNPKAILKRFESNVHFVNLPIIEDNEQNSFINQQLKKKVEECLSLVEPGLEVKESDSFIELVQTLYKCFQPKEAESFQKYPALAKMLQNSIVNAELCQ